VCWTATGGEHGLLLALITDEKFVGYIIDDDDDDDVGDDACLPVCRCC